MKTDVKEKVSRPESPFLEDGDDFCKSTTVNEHGKLLKAIPTMQKITKKVLTTKKTMPKGFDKFKKEVEQCFKILDGICKEISGNMKPEETGDLIKKYADFKREFSYKINSYIKNPVEVGLPEMETSEYDKTRIKL